MKCWFAVSLIEGQEVGMCYPEKPKRIGNSWYSPGVSVLVRKKSDWLNPDQTHKDEPIMAVLIMDKTSVEKYRKIFLSQMEKN